MRVQRHQIDLRHEAQHALPFGRRQRWRREGRGGQLQQRAASDGLHGGVPPDWFSRSDGPAPDAG
jgi:hypothetical protein